MIALFFTSHLFAGGAETRFARAFNHLVHNAGRTDIFLLTTNKTITALKRRGVEINKENVKFLPLSNFLEKNTPSIGRLIHIFYCFDVLLFLMKRNISRIHFCVDPSLSSFAASFFAPQKVTVSIVDSSRDTKQSFSWIRWLIWRETIKRARALDCLSIGIAENVRKLFKRTHDTFVSVCSFTDISKAPDNPKPLKDRKLDFVFVSRFAPKKGLDFMFESLKNINGTASMTIGIFGAGPLETYVDNNIMDLQANKNFVIQKWFAPNAFDILPDAKYFLSLQDLENYPSQSLMEAMACGCIPIATDVGETRKLVNKNTGFLVNTPDELANLMGSLVQKKEHDYKKSSTSSKLIKENYNVEIFTSYFDSFLRPRDAQ